MNKISIKRIACIVISTLALSACAPKLTYEEYKVKADKCEKEMHGKVQAYANKHGEVLWVNCVSDGFTFTVK